MRWDFVGVFRPPNHSNKLLHGFLQFQRKTEACLYYRRGPSGTIVGTIVLGRRLVRLQKKFLEALGHRLDGGRSADGPLELPPFLIVEKGNAIEHGRDSAHQVHMDTALRLRKFQGHASYPLMAVWLPHTRRRPHRRGRRRRSCRRSGPFSLLHGVAKDLLHVLRRVASADSVLAGALGQAPPGWHVSLQRKADANLELATLLRFS